MNRRWLLGGLAAACLAPFAMLSFSPVGSDEIKPLAADKSAVAPECPGCDARHARLAEKRLAVEGSDP